MNEIKQKLKETDSVSIYAVSYRVEALLAEWILNQLEGNS